MGFGSGFVGLVGLVGFGLVWFNLVVFWGYLVEGFACLGFLHIHGDQNGGLVFGVGFREFGVWFGLGFGVWFGFSFWDYL